MTCVNPALHIIFATSFVTIEPRFRIFDCFEYGKYGMTATHDLADDVLLLQLKNSMIDQYHSNNFLFVMMEILTMHMPL